MTRRNQVKELAYSLIYGGAKPNTIGGDTLEVCKPPREDIASEYCIHCSWLHSRHQAIMDEISLAQAVIDVTSLMSENLLDDTIEHLRDHRI